MDAFDILNALQNLPWEIRDQLIFCRFCHNLLGGEAEPYCHKCGRQQNLLPLAQQLLSPELYQEVRRCAIGLNERDHQSIHRMIQKNFRALSEHSKQNWQFCPKCGHMFED